MLPPKIRSDWVNFDSFVFDDGCYHDSITLVQIGGFLDNFGASIESLSFRPFDLEQIPNVANLALKMIHKHCKNIENLKIEITKKQDEIALEIRSSFAKFKVLHIQSSKSSTPDLECLSACMNVEELKVETNSHRFQMPEIPFPKMRKFEHSFDIGILRFLEQSLQIEELNGTRYHSLPPDTVRYIAQNMLNLKKAALSCMHATDLAGLNFVNNPILSVSTMIWVFIDRMFHLKNITQI